MKMGFGLGNAVLNLGLEFYQGLGLRVSGLGLMAETCV